MEQLDQQRKLGKLSDQEALGKYTNLLDLEKRNQKQTKQPNPELLFKIEKEIYDLNQDISKQKEKDRKEAEQNAEKLRKINQDMIIDSLKAADKEFEAKRKQLEFEKAERLKVKGVDVAEVNTWYNESLKGINKDEKEKKDKKKEEKRKKDV